MQTKLRLAVNLTGILLLLSFLSIVHPASAQVLADLDEGEMSLLIQNVNLAPNPFDDQIIVSYTLSEDSEVALEIYNALGQKVYQYTNSAVVQQAGTYHLTLPRLRDMNSGMYFVKLTIPNKGSLTRRVIAR